MANDDVATPTKLLGKKIAPIYEQTDENFIMGESLDIIKKSERHVSVYFHFQGASI